MWLTSSKALPVFIPVIMLVVIPFSATILAIVLSRFVPLTAFGVGGGFIYFFSFIYLISIICLVYGFYPIKFRNIERRGFSNLLIEHTYIKKILYIEIPILIVATFFISVFQFYDFSSPQYQTADTILRSIGKSLDLEGYRTHIITLSSSSLMAPGEFLGHYFFNGLIMNLGISVTAGIIWMVLVAARKEIGYYLAKSLFQTITHELEEPKKAQYLIKATKTYDKYLRRTLNLEINNVKKIYSKILSDSNLNKNESFRLISGSFDGNDKLEPIKCFSKILDVKETDTFLVDESIGKRIKDMAIFFTTIIPVAVTIIQLLLQR
jgi:hypothetical protein